MTDTNTLPSAATAEETLEFDYDLFIEQLAESEARSQEPKPVTYDVIGAKIHPVKTPFRNLFSDPLALIHQLGMYVAIPAILGLAYKLLGANAATSMHDLRVVGLCALLAFMLTLIGGFYSTILMLNVGFEDFYKRFDGRGRQLVLGTIGKNLFTFRKYIALNVLLPSALFASAWFAVSYVHEIIQPALIILAVGTYIVSLFHGKLKRVNLNQIAKIGDKL